MECDCKTCLENVFEYIDNELDKETKLIIDGHLKNCESCAKTYRDEKNMYSEPLTDIFDEIDHMELDDSIKTRIHTSFHDTETGQKDEKA